MSGLFLKLKDSIRRDMLINPDQIKAVLPSTDGRTYVVRLVDGQELPISSTFSDVVSAIQSPIRPYTTWRGTN